MATPTRFEPAISALARSYVKTATPRSHERLNEIGENITLLLEALDVQIKAFRTKIQISGSMPIVPETDENFVTIEQTLALPRECSLLCLWLLPLLGLKLK